MMLKSLHTVITEEYGYSPYVSYALFAVGTIIVGAALGMVSLLISFLFVATFFFRWRKLPSHAPLLVAQRPLHSEPGFITVH